MSIQKAPSWMVARSGEEISQAFRQWIDQTKRKLLRAFPQGERDFARIVDKMVSRLPKRWQRRLWYTRQKYFVVADQVVFFGDFCFQNLNLLVEIDGTSHSGEVAQEKDQWREKLIADWKITTARITNAQLNSGDCREIEAWFIDLAANKLPRRKGDRLRYDYAKMRRQWPNIYDVPGLMTTRRA